MSQPCSDSCPWLAVAARPSSTLLHPPHHAACRALVLLPHASRLPVHLQLLCGRGRRVWPGRHLLAAAHSGYRLFCVSWGGRWRQCSPCAPCPRAATGGGLEQGSRAGAAPGSAGRTSRCDACGAFYRQPEALYSSPPHPPPHPNAGTTWCRRWCRSRSLSTCWQTRSCAGWGRPPA